MWKVLIILSLGCAQYKANAQLFTKYAVGISAIAERGIHTPRSLYNGTPMIYGGNLLLLTEDNKERVFITMGLGLTNYVRNDFRVSPAQLNPEIHLGLFTPKSSSSSTYRITHINIPISIGYKLITKKKINVYATVGVDLRFQVASKLDYVVKDSTAQILFERTDTDLPYLKKLQLFTISLGMEYKSSSGRFIYRIEPFIKVDSRKIFNSEDTLFNEFLSYAGAQVSCFYQLKLK